LKLIGSEGEGWRAKEPNVAAKSVRLGQEPGISEAKRAEDEGGSGGKGNKRGETTRQKKTAGRREETGRNFFS